MRANHIQIDGRKHPIFNNVPAQAVENLAAAATVKCLSARQLVLSEQERCESLFLLLRGSVRLYKLSDDGDEVTHSLACAPAIVGIECLFGHPSAVHIETLETVVLWELPVRLVHEAMSHTPALAKNLLSDTAANWCVSLDQQRAMSLPIPDRLARALATLTRQYGVPVEGGTQIRIPLTQDDLASLVGATRRSIGRALRDWAARGVVQKRRHHFVISKIEDLSFGEAIGLRSMISSTPVPRRNNNVVPLRRRYVQA